MSDSKKLEITTTQPVPTIKRALIWTAIYFAGSFLMVSLLSNNFKESIFQEDFIIPDIVIGANFFLLLYYWVMCLSIKKA